MATDDAAFATDRTHLAEILADARILLWTAEVKCQNGDYVWKLHVAPESLNSPLLEYTSYRKDSQFWRPENAPDYHLTEQAYREALVRGFDRYQQEFRILHQGQTIWLNETVRITKVSPTEWRLMGLLRDVTAKKQAEDAQRRAVGELRRTITHAQCMLWHAAVIENEQGIFVWSLQFVPSALQRQIFERYDESATTRLYDDFEVPQLPEMDARAAHAFHTGLSGYQQDFMITRRHDRRTFWLREHVAILPEGDRRWSVSGVMIDVTAQKTSELAHRDTELQLRHLLEQVDCIVWQAQLIPQPDGGYEWKISAPPSRLFRRLFKHDPVPPVHFWTPQNTPDFPEMDARWREAMTAGVAGYEQEFRYPVDDKLVWLHENVTVLHRGPNGITLAGVVVDITERKLAELQLTTEKERLAVTLRAMEEAVATVDPEGRILFLNRAAENLLQCHAEEVLGRPFSTIAALQAGHASTPFEWSFSPRQLTELPSDAQLVRPRGALVRIEGCVAPLHDPSSRPMGAVVVLRDVTERALLQAQLQRASTLESIGLLAGGIAHDFNNILTALVANLSLAEMDIAPGTEIAGYIQEARTATDRAAALARQLLTFARGGDPLLAAVNLNAVIEEVTRFTLRGRQVDHALDLAPDLWPARADRGQLAQIIQNLVLNAAQAMPNGGTIRISAKNEELIGGAGALRPGRYLHLSVSDTGRGIPADVLAKLFTPYFTTKSDGHGLGLAVVYSIVKKHKGSIQVRSAVGQGTTFDLRIPAAAVPATANGESLETKPGALSGRVLLMDDDEPILRVMEAYLRRVGLTVETAPDGAQAVEIYRAAYERGTPPDIVVMDLTIPGKMGGREAISRLKAIDPRVCAIVASGYSSDPILANYRDYGFCAMAAKPFDIEELGRQISQLLKRKRAGSD